MVGGLAGLTSLRTLSIEFQPLDELSDLNEGLEEERRLDLPMRAVLPALTEFVFCGKNKYLEDLMAQIDLPSVKDIKIKHHSALILDVPQLSRLIGRIARLQLVQFRHAQVTFGNLYSQITLDRPQCERHQVHFSLIMQISASDIDWNSDLDMCMCMAVVLGQFTAFFSNVRHLSFDSPQFWPEEMNCLDDSKLLPLLRLFPTVEELHVSGVLAGHIAPTLENIAQERVIEVMPVLHSLWFDNDDEPVGSIERFLSLRQLSGHPVTVRKGQADDMFDDSRPVNV